MVSVENGQENEIGRKGNKENEQDGPPLLGRVADARAALPVGVVVAVLSDVVDGEIASWVMYDDGEGEEDDDGGVGSTRDVFGRRALGPRR